MKNMQRKISVNRRLYVLISFYDKRENYTDTEKPRKEPIPMKYRPITCLPIM